MATKNGQAFYKKEQRIESKFLKMHLNINNPFLSFSF